MQTPCFTYLKHRATEREEKERACWFPSPPIHFPNCYGILGRAQAEVWSPTGVAEAQVLGLSSTAVLGTSAGSWISSRTGRIQAGAPGWDGEIPGTSVTGQATPGIPT